jgi:hypothetical protein
MGNKPYNCNSTNSKMSGGVGAIKSYEKGGLVTDSKRSVPTPRKRDSVQDAIDATKEFQKANDERYKAARVGSYYLGVYDNRLERARKNMQEKAAIAKRDRAFSNMMNGVTNAVQKKK